MPRTSQDWRAHVHQVALRLRPEFDFAGLPLPDPLPITIGGSALVSYDEVARSLSLGFAENDAGPTYELYGSLLSTDNQAELERILELLVTRFSVNVFARMLRVAQGTDSDDPWLEDQVANAVAYAATARLFEPSRPFLVDVLGRAISGLLERRLLDLPGPQGQRDPALSETAGRLLPQLTSFRADAMRTDVPALDPTLRSLLGGGLARRRSAESEVVLLQTFTQGPRSLRRAAAGGLFAQEARPEAIVSLLLSQRGMSPDVRLKLAVALMEHGAHGDAWDFLSGLATSSRSPPPVAAAAALLLNDPQAVGIDPLVLLNELEDAGLQDALRLLSSLPTTTGVSTVWPLLRHQSAPVRREAYRLLVRLLPEADAWAGVCDPDPAIRAACISMVSYRPGLPRIITQLLFDDDEEVRRRTLARARSDDGLAKEVVGLLMAQESDAGRQAAAAVVADRDPEWSDRVLRLVFARGIEPFALAVQAATAAAPANLHLKLVQRLANESLMNRRRELIAFAADARGRSDWITRYEAAEQIDSPAPGDALAAALPAGWFDALHPRYDNVDPLSALRRLAVTHPEPFVRAALLLWLARAGHFPAEAIAQLAAQDPSQTVSEVAPIVGSNSEEAMALTAIEKALFLRTSPLFRSVPTQSLLTVGGAMLAGNHAPDTTIVKQGDMGDRLFVLYDGEAHAERQGADGTKITLAKLSPGAVFGEMSLFDLEPRSATVIATTRCQTLMLDGQTFHRLGVEYPEILWEVCRVLSQRLRATGQSLSARSQQAA